MASKINRIAKILTLVLGISALLVVSGAVYTLNETQQAVITQFGDPVGGPIKDAGLHFKIPLIQKVNYFDKRILEWDGDPNQIPTKDKKYIFVDTTARWRIVDPLKFMQSVGNEMGAHARLDDIVDAVTRDEVTGQVLVEAVRDSNRLLETAPSEGNVEDEIMPTEALEKIEVGRNALTRDILAKASAVVLRYGIELIDVRIKRINYVEDVRRKVYERMISERKRAAEQYRSEGQGKKAEIEGQMTKELQQIQSEAYKKAMQIKGKADAAATGIYAEAYNKDPEFFSFLRTLEAYRQTLDQKTTLILTTESDYYEYLKGLKEAK